MSDNLVGLSEEIEPANDEQCNSLEISEFPHSLVTEKIIFCIDIVLLNSKTEETFIHTMYTLMSSYFSLKKRICAKAPEFEGLLIVNNDKMLHFYINNLKDLRTTFLGIEHLDFEEEENSLDVDKVLSKVASIMELPDPYCYDKCMPPPWVYHIIWLFGHNLYVPVMENTNAFDFLMMSPYVALDILYIYDNSSEKNCCSEIFQMLLGLNENGKGYFLGANCNNKEKISSCFAQLLGHPLIRPPQLKAKFRITELGPQEIINKNVTKDFEN